MSEIEADARRTNEIDEGRWQLLAGLVVLLGCLATIAYTIIETVWG
jgi:hypothetical protein